MRRIVFAPGRGLIAALTIAAHPKLTPQKLRYELLVWEASTGELKRKIITNAGHHSHTFFFVNPKHILAKAFSEEGVSLQLIDASTGNIDYLLKDVNFEMYGGSVHGELVPFAAAGGQMFAINWRNKEQIDYERPPAGLSSYIK